MNCTRCGTTGFLNLHEVDRDVLEEFETSGDHQVIVQWIEAANVQEMEHDVQICDCCGDGENDWHGVAGEHDEQIFECQ
jgi:hypothetical protein